MSLSEFPHHSASQIPSSPPPRYSLDSNTMNGQHTMVSPVAAIDTRHGQHLERQTRRDRISMPNRISVPNRRYSYRDPLPPPPPTPSSYYSSLSSPRSSSKQSSSDMIELLFTKLLDALIFTSAIAITAYNYWTGSLNNGRQQGTITAGPSSASSSSSSTPRTPLSPMAFQFPSTIGVNDVRPSWRQQQYNTHKLYDDNDPQQHHHKRYSSATSPLEDSRRKRTLKWAESVSHQQQQHKTPTKEREYNPDDNNDDDTSSSTSTIRISRSSKRRTQSLPPAPLQIENQHGAQDAHEKEDEMFNRMEERLQSLIEQGQAALSSRVDVNEHLDENEITMRRAFAARKKYSF